MAKATKLFLSSIILFLYTTLCIQGGTEYGDVTLRIPVHSMKTVEPLASLPAKTQRRVVCVPSWPCCLGNSPKDCHNTTVCNEIICNKPSDPLGSCVISTLACNCNNCV
ncbi:unnamed protein product [Urochloa decumbens]|uniref:Uncharacterized protein n=1 Tax=Urochloa decumbens TaxID=240449 RepID=A0ABC8W6V2_9POAL